MNGKYKHGLCTKAKRKTASGFELIVDEATGYTFS